MKITILTLFPQMFSGIEHSIIKRAVTAGHLEINVVDFRNWAKGKHKQVDDTAYGGGAGMLLKPEPIVECIEEIDPSRIAHRIYMTPAAPILNQAKVIELSQKKELIILCGHYEGVDQRAIDIAIDEVISIGEFVLTGGELAAQILVDAVGRYVSGVIKPESLERESYSDGETLEHPQYTKPREYRGYTVPEVLLSGNHGEIEKWKTHQSKIVTHKFKN